MIFHTLNYSNSW